ncbi:hypothetical protein [Longimicrobium sp.]|uniref:hypothetical protein n=1 Tax=Longimicrobium sp. TaxID=2029185 RepID=UPI003B3B97E5
MSRAALVLAATAMLGACESDGTGPDDHHEPAGMVIVGANNATLVTINAARQVTGSLTVRAGQGAHVEVFFVDEDGDRFQPDGDEHTLEWTVANEAIAEIHSHDDHMDLEGVAVGATTVEFRLMHGNHPDYTAPGIPITVTP